jgi:peptidyl-prolyl cis-trans isomerase-like 2
MVKKQKDKQYQSAREHRATQQERSGSAGIAGGGVVQRRLPFSHCALTLVPFETPVCNRQGILFENTAVVAFILRHKVDPVTGEAADTSSLIHLNMDKNEEGVWQCPIMTKPFTDHSKVIAIIQPDGKVANVYSNEAYQELNVKTKNYEDLQSGAKFDKNKHVLVLFDPSDEELNRARDINTFYHVRNARELEKTKEPESRVRHNTATSRVMEKLQKVELQRQDKRKADRMEESKRTHDIVTADDTAFTTSYFSKDGKRLKVLAQDVTGVAYTENQGAATSLTSTAVRVVHDNAGREATLEEIVQGQCAALKSLQKKGLVRLRTNRGTLTLELHCDMVPRTCLNFMGLCQAHKYDNTLMHRLIPKFMIQGGKPASDDEKEECLWGGAFVDEFDDRLKHKGPGIVSMANAGANTNKRQFFITFATCGHLDRKHSVFGKVVDGNHVLSEWEQIAADKRERPRQEIKILGTDVLVDPTKEARELEQERLEKIIALRLKKSNFNDNTASPKHVPPASIPQIGRYLKLQSSSADTAAALDDVGVPTRPSHAPPAAATAKYGDFSGW